ncbi:hypothetical protein [Herbaspirillum huttiense]|jgi:hypothetical protein|uniref:Uncharacterized protein n=2 Tax=Herbaspirillum huttiense TaxID=863372 RepID=A0AAJ2LTD5_9BURK|nr:MULTISPECIES: hypothetical protein [Herbaspirillum]MDR9836150.1 hypothetical protein [Herbaspirillum huttiense]UWE17041.1 hypothetical protein NY669_02365 [Herbaspirillum huttiense]
MPVARAYFLQLFLGTLYAVLFLCLVPMVAGAAMLFIPAAQWQQWGLDQWQETLQEHRETVYWLVALLMAATLVWFYCGMDRVIGKAKPRWRPAYWTTTLIYMLAMTYGVAIALVTHTRPHYQQCQMYTEKLNGGLRHYRGEDFMVELCGAGSDDQRRDQIRLRIFDEQGQWRAVRYFTVQWGGHYPLLIDYARDHLAYFDASEGEDEEFVKVVAMPPTLADWLSTRIPLLD